MIKVIDATHFLVDGDLPPDESPVRREALAVARLVEYAGPLEHGESCVTLLECRRRPAGARCGELLWVRKTTEDAIEAWCPRCREMLYVVSNWQDTLWADGPMVLPRVLDGERN